MKYPKISIVTVSYNQGQFIEDNITTDTYRLDSRPEQLMFGISYSFTKKKE